MATSDETLFTQMNKETKANGKQNMQGWQTVTIGGITGIMMGAGAMYAIDALGKDPTKIVGQDMAEGAEIGGTVIETAAHMIDNGLQVANVDQNLSFGQAFEAARNAVGPGGVFHWHGNIYNTYTKDEWDNMSAGEKSQFAQLVQPEIWPGEGHPQHHQEEARHDPKHEDPTKPEPIKPDPPKPEPNEDDGIHFLGFTNVQVDGQEYLAGQVSAKINGEERQIYYIDVDNAPDNEFDVRVEDLNGDGVLTSQEALDVRDHHLNVGEFALISALEGTNQNPNQTAMINQNEIANDMPDYVNDADATI